MNKEVEEYDRNKNLIYFKSSFGSEYWQEFDKNNNVIYYKFSDNSNNYEYWYKYDENRQIEITEQEFKQIERIKLYLNNKKINRFSLMDI